MPPSEQIAWIAFLHTALYCAAMAYAKFLNQKHIYEWYSPDRVWMTVVGGDILIWPFISALYFLSLPWWGSAVVYITLHFAAGIPIIRWQRARAKKRHADVEAIRSGNTT